VEEPPVELLEHEPLRHRHLRSGRIPRAGDPVTGRVRLLVNGDVAFGVCRPAERESGFYKNADGDDLVYVHEGGGRLESMFGPLEFRAGDYLVIPRGVIHRFVVEGDATLVTIESASGMEIPRRYRNEYGQLLEHAPYCERDVRVPRELETHDERGTFRVRIRARGVVTVYEYPFHPFDVVGWDGFLYPWAISIHDFEPITKSIHAPPPAHQMFEAHSLVVCSFVPRMLDYHPEAVPIPYNHSNLDSDEVLFYCNDQFGSRKGIEVGSITLHPSGLPHGPQPGAVEASLGKTRTEELAVMLDTFRPLQMTRAAAEIEDEAYSWSWKTT